MKQIRKRVTYANVMSSIAVFLVLGGGAAYAAKKIGSNEIKGNSITTGKLKKEAVTSSKLKKNSVTTPKIANGAVTGAKLNLGTVGTVPNAAHATNADNANNANTVGGLRIVKFSLNGASPIGNTQILDFNGLQIQASCAGGSVTATAHTAVNGGEISAWANDASSETSEGEFDDTFNIGDTLTLPAPTNSDVLGDGAYTGGDLRTVRFFYNEEDSVGTNDCLFNGYAIG
ncbi:MAG: hypothetical protein QOF85_1187 [Solirubrobacterales bacterium]|nr:hypothetical protein [Solirubrobacterales bacterium]